MRYDATITGRSFTGPSAAMYLSRARKTACVLDTGELRRRFIFALGDGAKAAMAMHRSLAVGAGA